MKESLRTERDFVLKRLVPLLRKLGFHNVHHTHGTDEYGRDLILYDYDRFGIERPYGAQAKFGDISGAAGTQIDKITAQIDDAFVMPYSDIRTGEEKYIVGLYIIISGKFKRNAREKIRRKCQSKPVFFLDGADIDNLELKISKSEPDRETKELKRLQRQALAACRQTPEDIHLFEQKLHEIDLLEDCSIQAKIEALAELGLEVPLNSNAGTKLLVEHLLWQVAGWNKRSLIEEICARENGRNVLEAIASTLWEIGLESVEYHRSKAVVQEIADAIVEVYDKATILESHQAQRLCKTGLESMLQGAHAEKRNDLFVLLQSALGKLH